MTPETQPERSPEDVDQVDELAETVSVLLPKTKTDYVYEALRQGIVAGRYPSGGRIVADQVALELGISKVPVREAIVRLVGEGWLLVKPHSGAVVPEMSPDDILDSGVLRAAVEGLAVRLAAGYITPRLLGGLRDLVDRMDRVAARDHLKYPKLNLEFHSASIECCPYPSLRTMAASLAEKTYRLAPVRLQPKYLPESQIQHRELLQALEQRRGEEAERLLRHHVERSSQLLWRIAMERVERRRHHTLRPTCFCGLCSGEKIEDPEPPWCAPESGEAGALR